MNEDYPERDDLYWHALNYRGAAIQHAADAWIELIACHERLVSAAVAAERERCARLCEGDAPLNMGKASMIAVDAFAGADWNAHSGFVCAQHACAAAIRKG